MEASQGFNVNSLYYNNNIESIHFREKTKQCHELLSSTEVIGTLRMIVEQQQDDEILALYVSGPYKLSKEKILSRQLEIVFNVLGRKKKLVLAFRNYKPSLEDQFKKQK